MKKMCMLEDNKTCDNCCECNVCDLDPDKVCDNCAKCIETCDSAYRSLTIKEMLEAEELRRRLSLQKAKVVRRKSESNL